MDFILSLTHFCEVHGPTSILCSQILPTPCRQCGPDSPGSSPDGSPSSPSSSLIARDAQHSSVSASAVPDLSASPSSVRCVTTSAIEPLATPPASAPVTAPRIEDHPWFASDRRSKAASAGGIADSRRISRLAGADGDTCASCRLRLPDDVSRQLPADANGALAEHKQRHSSPVLRSREVVYACRGVHAGEYDADYDSNFDDAGHYSTSSGSQQYHQRHLLHPRAHSHQQNILHASSPASAHSSSFSSDSSCHAHVVTYLSMRGPANPDDYALLRRASIRTLSCELLPRGLSSGPLSFGDPSAGYTVAYVFRLPDPMARGKRRSYALVALAGKDAGRTFRASPVIWRTFARIANNIVSAAEKFQESESHAAAAAAAAADYNNAYGAGPAANGRSKSNYTPVSSFLTGRALDPDGQPRRAGQVRARNLTEIVGNEYIFAELHAQFVGLLQQLGAMFSSPSDYSDMYEDSGRDFSSSGRDRFRGSDRGSDRTGTSISSTTLAKQFSQLHMSTSVPKPIPISQRRKMVA